jgi:regulator of protease activity HflC (stomatin/prohibitin superfamily)
MNRDQFVYQQATRVSVFGLAIQVPLGLFLLIFGRVTGDSSFILASVYVLTGVLIWLSLIVLFHQHGLERIEALENEEIDERRVGDQRVFEGEREPSQAASRRLLFMHQWLMPTMSGIVAILLSGISYFTITWLARLDDTAGNAVTFGVGGFLGWQLAICAVLALFSFIFSRFVAGMAQKLAWQNLRGGAGAMVGNALVLLAIAVGIVFQVFRKPAVLEGIAYGIAIFLAIIAAEIFLNLILNIYRPRRHNELSRPAFDSKLLGLAAAPDSIVRSINEAVNYQFGFDITSSWGYQLLLRSILRLSLLGIVVLILMSMVVVVQPGEQAVRLRGGKVVGEIAHGSLVLKWPWPFESIERFNVGQIRSLVLGSKLLPTSKVNLWPIEGEPDSSRRPFIVLAKSIDRTQEQLGYLGVSSPLSVKDQSTDTSQVVTQFALVDADIVLEYRVKEDGLLEYLNFSGDIRSRRTILDMRERALRALALREVSQYLSTRTLDQVLSPTGDSLVLQLKQRIQAAFDRSGSGVEVVGILIPVLRPPAGEPAGMFEELSIDIQNARKVVDEANRLVNTTMSTLVGSPDIARRVVLDINLLRDIEREHGKDSPEALQKRSTIENMIVDARAQAASIIGVARARRWSMLMSARATASEVLGQAPSYRAAPEIYRERAIMAVLSRALAAARIKYVLAIDPSRIEFDVQMEQPEPGLNLGDYLEKKE